VKRDDTLAAYKHLGVSRDSVLAQPRITPTLRILEREINRPLGEGVDASGRPVVFTFDADASLDYLAASEDPDALAVVATANRVPPYYRSLLPIEAFCAASGVRPHRILELILARVVMLGARAASVMTAVGAPRVARLVLENAGLPGREGVRDRELVLKSVGVIPSPKGAQTIVNVSAQSTASAASAAAPVQVAAPEATIRRLVDHLNAALPAPEPVAALPFHVPAEPVAAVSPADVVDADADADDDLEADD